jgi:Ca-activated chloride channel family protein
VDKTPQRPAEAALQSARIANATPAGSLAFAQTATDAPMRMLIGAISLILAIGLMRRRGRAAARVPV